MKGKYIPFLVLPLFIFLFILVSPLGIRGAVGEGQAKSCPNALPWVRKEGLGNTQEDTYDAGTGYLITRICYKANQGLGSSEPYYFDLETPKQEYTLTIYPPSGNRKLNQVAYKIYEICSETKKGDEGDWSEWEINSGDESKLIRYRTIELIDSKNESNCGKEIEEGFMDRPLCEWPTATYKDEEECIEPIEEEVEEEEIEEEVEEDESEVLGEKKEIPVDEEEVLGEKDEIKEEKKKKEVEVVLTETGANSNTFVYVIQTLLTVSTLLSGIFFSKKYIM